MKTEILHKKLDRYLKGESPASEKRQIQSWLSCTSTSEELVLTSEEKQLLEKEILLEIQAHTNYPILYPKKEVRWWEKIAALF